MVQTRHRWLREYENRRLGRGRASDGQFGWTSSRYDLESKDWDNIRDIFIPQLEMTFGQACSALKRSWYAYKMSRKEVGGYNNDLAWRINRIQHYLGIPLTEFSEGLDPNWVKQQLNAEEQAGEEVHAEELELRYEEDQDRSWNDSETSESEDPEYAQLREEEKEDLLNSLKEEEW